MFVHVVSCSTEGKLMSPPCPLQDGNNRGRIVESSKMFDHCVSVVCNQKKVTLFIILLKQCLKVPKIHIFIDYLLYFWPQSIQYT